jgi:hypothetical protein
MTDIQQAKEQARQIENLLHEQIRAFRLKYPELHLSISAESYTLGIKSNDWNISHKTFISIV